MNRFLDTLPDVPAAVPTGGRVTASSGTVRLFGCVADEDDRKDVERRIRNTGPHNVVQEMKVCGPDDPDSCEDAMVAASVCEALLPYIDLAYDTLNIRVEKGWVELEGEVEDFRRRERLAQILRDLQDIKGFTNSLNVRSDVTVEQLKRQVARALDRVTRAVLASERRNV